MKSQSCCSSLVCVGSADHDHAERLMLREVLLSLTFNVCLPTLLGISTLALQKLEEHGDVHKGNLCGPGL